MNDGKRKVVLDRAWLKSPELKDAEGTKSASAGPKLRLPACGLKSAAACCLGRGYVVAPRGSLAHADLCACVTNCAACLGQARVHEGNSSRPCRTPAPNVVANLINGAMIPARYADASIDRFQNFSGNAERMLGELSKWKSRFTPVKGTGIVISGPVGVGKTFLLAALAKEMAERGHTVRFTDFFQLLGELKAGFSEGKADAAQLAPLIDVDVLVIDELGKGRNNDFELTVLDQLVCGRYNQNKTIIASTNYNLKQEYTAHNYNVPLDQGASPAGFADGRFESLETRIGPRIFSRLREMTHFYELTGSDFRQPDMRPKSR